MDSSEKVLKIAEAKSKDAGRGIARVDPAVMDVLGITAGAFVRIEGKKKTVAIVWPGSRRMPIEVWYASMVRSEGTPLPVWTIRYPSRRSR